MDGDAEPFKADSSGDLVTDAAPGTPTIQTRRIDDDVAVAVLSRPAQANALDSQLIRDLQRFVDGLLCVGSPKVIIVTGAGRHFCGGADLKERKPPGWLAELRRAFDSLSALDAITIAAINGSCMGGGFELALACDFRVAADTAMIGLPEITFGMLPAAGGGQRLSRLIGPARAKWLIMSGERLAAGQALELGILDEVVESSELMMHAESRARRLAQHAGYALRTAKGVIDDGFDRDLGPALAAEYKAIDTMASAEELKEEAQKAAQRSATYKKLLKGHQ